MLRTRPWLAAARARARARPPPRPQLRQDLDVGDPAFSGCELHFLGSGGTRPSPTRALPCTAVRRTHSAWLFDCGDGSSRQLEMSPIKAASVDRIFVTHTHADHVTGLPGLLVALTSEIASTKMRALPPLTIYGPPGVWRLVTATLQATQMNAAREVRVVELTAAPGAAPGRSAEPAAEFRSGGSRAALFKHGRDAASGTWDIVGAADDADPDPEGWTVRAQDIPHVPRRLCFGFVLQEPDVVGRLDARKCAELGVHAGPLRGPLKRGEDVRLPDTGAVVRAADVLGPSRRARKLAILGDTYDGSRIAELARGADVLVHEASFVPSQQRRAQQRGHATSTDAVRAAKAAGARVLVLNHFGYQLPQGPRTDRLVRGAQRVAGDDLRVLAASEDYLVDVGRYQPLSLGAGSGGGSGGGGELPEVEARKAVSLARIAHALHVINEWTEAAAEAPDLEELWEVDD